MANAEQPSGQTSRHIRQAIRRAGAGGVVVLSGTYQIEQTIDLPDGLTLCSSEGATLTWTDPDRAGHILSANRAQNTVIRGLILEGRGIVVKGKGHRIEGNLIRNIRIDSDRDSRWGERHGIFIQDMGDGLQIRQNVFTQIGDTSIMGFNVRNSQIAGNSFIDLNEGIHLFAVGDTLISDNTGARIRAMSIEIQGEDLPGLRIENNRFRDWRPEPKGSLYAMSVVAGQGAVVQGNVVECAPGMLAALEIGGQAPQILNNALVNADMVIALAYDAVIRGNSVKNASILKDVNRVKRGSLLIEGNTVEEPPRVGIFADEWGGYEQITVRGNRIHKRITEETGEFLGMVTSPYRKQMAITDNVFKVENAGRKRPIRAVCIANYGYKGNLSGLQVSGNTCDGDGITIFGDSNSLGGHAGIVYRNNSLVNLKDTIVGHVEGLQASGNALQNVAADHAKLRRP